MLASAYKKYSGKPDADRRLLEKFNRNNDTAPFIKEGPGKAVMILTLIRLNGSQELIN